jgi:hypothetical protein
MLDPKIVRSRLAFIRRLYRLAVEQSNQPEPLRAFSVLTFHDAVELFLGLALEHNGAVPGKRDVSFSEYWELLAKADPQIRLFGKPSMLRLNLARVALKHHGLLPSTSTVEDARSTVKSFFEENCQEVFGIAFDSISMVDVVAFAPVREHLIRAERAIAESDFDGAAKELGFALAKLLDKYDPTGYVLGPPAWSPLSARAPGFDPDDEAGRWVKGAVERLAEVVRALALGLDNRRHAKFRRIIPHVQRIRGPGSGQPEFDVVLQISTPRTREQCEECLAFVVDSALRVQK